MDPIKVSVDVNLHLSEKTERFILELFSSKALISTKKPIETNDAQTEKLEAPVTTTQEQTASQVLAETPKTEATVASSSNITIDDVRNALKAKVATHRAEIKDKLTELGAPSVTKLEQNKYQEMLNYLNSLD